MTAAGTPLSILMVDDDVDFCESLATILRSDQVEVRTAATLHEAEGLLRRLSFDLVITDLRLSGAPDFEGLQVIGRAKEKAPATRVVLLTAFGGAAVERAAKRLGALECWSKGMPVPDLIARLRGLGVPVRRTPPPAS